MATSAQIKKVNHWQERLLDALIAEPEVSLGELAKRFGVTQAWLSTVKNSDAFVDEFRRRSSAHSEALLGGLQAKTRAVAEMAVDELARRLEHEAQVLPFPIVLETAETMLKRSGFGESKSAPTPNLQVNVGVVTQSELAEARSAMRELKPTIPLVNAPALPALGGREAAERGLSEIQGPQAGATKSEGPGSCT